MIRVILNIYPMLFDAVIGIANLLNTTGQT